MPSRQFDFIHQEVLVMRPQVFKLFITLLLSFGLWNLTLAGAIATGDPPVGQGGIPENTQGGGTR
jgi:hypothetical protein